MIEKKFNMFSTKEWLQFLQYKISPEREKDLMDKAATDPFLREAVDAISTQENRPVAFQSLSYLIGQVEDATGVSESNITSEKIRRRVDPDMNKKLILIIGGIFLAGLIAFGIYYFISNRTEVIDAEEMNESEATTVPQETVDTSSKPFDMIPTATPMVDSTVQTPSNIPLQSTTKKKTTATSSSSPSYTASPSYTEPKSTATVTSTPAPQQVATPSRSSQVSKERELFNQAQDMFKQGNRDGAKQILNQLNSYDNPMKSQSNKILENMNSSGN